MSKNCTKSFQLPWNHLPVIDTATGKRGLKSSCLVYLIQIIRGFFLFKKQPLTSLFYVLVKYSFKHQEPSGVFWRVHFKEISWSSTSGLWMSGQLHRTAMGKYTDHLESKGYNWVHILNCKFQMYQRLVFFHSLISDSLNLHLWLCSFNVVHAVWISLLVYPSPYTSPPHQKKNPPQTSKHNKK